MADHKMDPWYRAIRHNMESIIRCVEYKRVKYKLVQSELIEIEDLEEYDKLPTDSDAVSKIVMKVMCCIDDCEMFVKVLQQVPKYRKLTEKITKEYEENSKDAMQHSVMPPLEDSNQPGERDTTITTSQAESPHQVSLPNPTPLDIRSPVTIPEQVGTTDQIRTMAQTRQAHMDTLRQQKDPDKLDRLKAMLQGPNAGTSFATFLESGIKLLQHAIEKNVLCFKDSVKQTILSSLEDYLEIVESIIKDFRATKYGTKDYNTLIDKLAKYAIKVTDIIKSARKTYWLRWRESARRISALIPIFEHITEAMRQIRNIDWTPYSELIGSVEELHISLLKIEQTLDTSVEITQNLTNVIIIASGIACTVVGMILCSTVAAVPAGATLMCIGGCTLIYGVLHFNVAEVASNQIATFTIHGLQNTGMCKSRNFLLQEQQEQKKDRKTAD